MLDTETKNIKERYSKRSQNDYGDVYSPLNPYVYMWKQELERVLIKNILAPYLQPLNKKTLLEIGCGNGINLLEFIRLGFLPENITGIELLPERAEHAKSILPKSITVINDDATNIDSERIKYDVVFQSTVFTSILDQSVQIELANIMWQLAKPGGGILWYDFIYNNPNNPDVRGVPIKRIRELFPEGEFITKKVTLAPPIARALTRLHPALYTTFNTIPFLRTHALCWIKKNES